MIDFEQLFRSYVSIGHHPTKNGWYPVLCQVCNDHGNKGKRAAFNFEDGVGYHCFNCGHVAGFNERSTEVSDDLVRVFDSFHVPKSEWEHLHIECLSRRKHFSLRDTSEHKPTKSIEPKVLELPKHFVPLLDYDPEDTWRFIAEDHLQDERGIDPLEYPFYLSAHKDWLGRLIIPIYNRRNELIYYQGRSLIDHPRKYLSPPEGKSKVMYGFNQIYAHSISPLFIVEGFFDAFVIGGCATLGNELTEEHIEHLNRSQRRKILIPDKWGDGHLMANKAIELGWEVSTPAIGDCKDISAAVKKYGKMYVLKTIMENAAKGFMAEINVNVYCK